MKTTKSLLLAGVSALVACSFLPASAFAVQEVSSRPILFVHGFSPLALPENCSGVWSEAESELAAAGFTGPMVTVGYYGDDINCDIKSSPKGSIMTSIPDLAHDFAWMLYNGWSSKQEHVDIIAHSLGGLIVRYAFYRAAIGDPAYPPFLIADHIVSMGAPYTGFSLLAFSCYLNPVNVQCWEMAPYAGFIQDLKAPAALLPQGVGGTLWTNIGSNGDVIDSSDGVVGSDSATSMPIPTSSKTVIPWYKLIFHTTYYHHSFVVALASAALVKTTEDASSREAAVVTSPVVTDGTPPTCAPVKPVPGTLTGVAPATHFARAELMTDFTSVPYCQRPGKIAPNLVNDDQQGVVFSQILPGGLFDRMGLLNGDIATGCTPDTLNQPFDAIESGNTLSFCVTRDGKQLSREFTLE